MFEKGQRVQLNPSIGPHDFARGRAGVGYDEVGTVQRIVGTNVVVSWPSYGVGWHGLKSELVPISMENV